MSAGGPEAFFPRVLELAGRGRYSTSPNPRVGAIVVSPGGAVSGEGFHERAGGPHAEAAALAAAGSAARGGTVLVNLEPCAHAGRTPPCAEALVEAGVARVVCSLEDPDPRTAGRGIAFLRAHGVAVAVGAMAAEAALLNEPFLASVRAGRPYVHLKWAMTLDGRIAARTGRSRWISCDESREDAMRLREEHDAILCGAGTVLADDPLLTRRLGLNRSILPHRRIVVDGKLRVRPGARVFEPGGERWLATARAEDDPELEPFRQRGVTVLSLPDAGGRVDLAALLERLGALEVRSLLVEGGGGTTWGFVASGLVDRVTAYVAPKLLGGADAPTPVAGEGFSSPSDALMLDPPAVERIGVDWKLTAAVRRPAVS